MPDKLYNLMGRPVTVIQSDGAERLVAPEKFAAKEVQEEVEWDSTDGIPTVRWLWHVSGLPVPQDGIVYLVTPMVLSVAALMGRTTKDLRSPANMVPNRSSVYRTLITL